MTASRSLRRAPRPAARDAATAAKALAVAVSATVAAVALSFVVAGPAVAAAQAPRQAPAASAKVKYYVVPPPGHGSVPTLYSIAAATLGNGSLFMEIFNLNKGRLQPNGQRLENPHSVEPGWILLLPPGASGPGVHFGPLPAVAKATSRVVHRHPPRSQATAAANADHGSGTLAETVIGGALLVFAAAGLGLVVRRRRRLGGGGRRPGGSGRRPPTHAMDEDPGSDWVRSLATDGPRRAAGPSGAVPRTGGPGAGGPSWPEADHPSWPASDPGQPVSAATGYGQTTGTGSPDMHYQDHPSWPASDPGQPVSAATGYGRTTASGSPDMHYQDHPSWPASDPGQPVSAATGYGRTTGSADVPYQDYPSWPANSLGRPLTPDHPSWPASDLGPPVGAADYGQAGGSGREGWLYPDHPSWPASDLGHPVADDYPSWPAADPSGGRAGPGGPVVRPGGPPPENGPGLPQGERLGPAPTVHHDPGPGQAVAQVPPARGRHVRIPGGYSGAAGSTGDTPQRWSAQLARSTGPIPQTYYDLDFGDGRLQVMLTETPGADPGWAGPAAHGGNLLQLPGPATAGQPGPVSWDTGNYDRTDSVRLAERVLADADQQAAAIRQEATSQAVAIRQAAEQEAAEIRQQAAAETAPIREAADREASEIKQQAAAQVAAVRETAEREIAELRATVLAMSDELTRVATYVTESLTSPGQPVVSPPRQAGPQTRTTPAQAPPEPDAKPPAEPAAKSSAKPAAKPAGKPGAKRGARPATKPAGKPGTSAKGRQISAMHKMVAAFVTLAVVGVVAGSAEISLHGMPFFVFRANGAGASLTGPKEDQGPGQPDAPGTHHSTPTAAPSPTSKAHGHGAKAKAHKSRAKNPQGKSQGKQPKGQQTPKPAKSN